MPLHAVLPGCRSDKHVVTSRIEKFREVAKCDESSVPSFRSCHCVLSDTQGNVLLLPTVAALNADSKEGHYHGYGLNHIFVFYRLSENQPLLYV